MITKILCFGLVTFMIVNANPMPLKFQKYPEGNSIMSEMAMSRQDGGQRVYFFEETTEMNDKGNNYIVENLKDLVPLTNNALSSEESRKRPINLEEEFDIFEKPRKPRHKTSKMDKRFGGTTVDDSQYGIKDGPTGYESVSDENENSGSDDRFYNPDVSINGGHPQSYYPYEHPGMTSMNVQIIPEEIPGQVINSAKQAHGPEDPDLLNPEIHYGDPRADDYGNQGLIAGTIDNVLHNHNPFLGHNSHVQFPGQPIRHPIGNVVSTGMVIPHLMANTGKKILNLF